MEIHEQRQFSELLFQLAEVYQRQLSDLQVNGYWMGLRDLPLADVRGGMLAAFRHSEYFPTPAEIRRLAYSGESQPAPSRPALPEAGETLTSREQAKAHLAAIQAMLDAVADHVTPPAGNAEEVEEWAAIGRGLIDQGAVTAEIARLVTAVKRPRTERARARRRS